MKKTLLVAAMMASFTGAAVAQNSVTLYGRLSPSMVYSSVDFNNKAATTLGRESASGTYNQFGNADGYAGNASMYGLRGVEDLGNGLKISFQFEEGLSTNDANKAATGNRVAALTVSNASWGSIGFGRDTSAANALLAGFGAIGAAAYGVGSPSNSMQADNQRLSNQIKYMSPTFSGLRFGASYSFNDSATAPVEVGGTTFGTTNKNRRFNGGLRYSNGPIALGAVYTQINPANAAGETTIKNWTLGATYDLKVVKLHAGYGQNIDGLIARTTFQSGIFTGDFDTAGSGALVRNGARTNQYHLGLTAPVGAAGRVAASFAQQKPGGNLNVAATATQTNIGITYTYSMSKRTSLFAGYSYGKNVAMIDGITVSQLGGGIQHTF